MLDTENPNDPTAPEQSTAPAPRRRRAATRPAGAAKAEAAKKPSAAEEATVPPSSDLTPKRRRASTKAEGATTATRRRKVAVSPDEAEAVAAPAQEAPAAAVDQAPTKPVRRRATRKAAAPVDGGPVEVTAEVPVEAATQAPAEAAAESAPAEPVAETPAKAPARRRRATRPAAQPAESPAPVAETVAAEKPVAAAGPVEEPRQDEPAAVEADEAPAAETPAKAPAKRRRATRPAAAPATVQASAPATEPPAEVAAPAVEAPAETAVEQAPPVEAAPAEQPAVVEAPAPSRRRRATRGAAAPAASVATQPGDTAESAPVPAVVPAPDLSVADVQGEPVTQEAASQEVVPDEVASGERPAAASGRNRRRRASRSAAAPEPRQAAEASGSDDPIGAALKAAEDLAEARRSVLADPFMTAEARAAELAALAGAIAADADAGEQDEDEDVDLEAEADESPATDEPTGSGDEEGDDEAGEDESSDDDSDDDRPARRRRRRGGRRRRRNGSGDDSDDSDEDASDDSDEPADTPEGEGNADGSENGEQPGSSDDNGSSTRRRRRRRRRETDGGGSAEDEVTGIEGSTRMEAKRQRRKESRAAGRRRAPILSEAEFLARRESVDRRLVIRQAEDYTQLVVIEDDVLVEHYVDKASATSLIGNIYLGKVQNVLPSMEAAFIDIGRGRNAVLYAGEVDWAGFGVTGGDRKVENVLKSGQSVLVQVTKDPVGAKGARLTSHISLPGRYIVYSPGGHLSGISRKLPEGERQRLRTVLGHLISEDESVIVRTAAEGVSEDELVRDVNRLKAQWEVIEKKSKTGGAPQALYAEPDLTLRIVRDLFTEDFGHLIVQGNGEQDDAFDAISAYVGHVAPHLIDRVERFTPGDGGSDVFARFRVDEQIAKALDRKVYLPSGGSLVIDRTEAMTVVDVNTGRFTGSAGNLEATVTSNNLEAAEEIVRQLRLRDLGGIIVIDFIDMVLPSNRDLLLRRLVECLGRDRTRHQVAEVTSLGLVQLTRKKIGTGLQEAFTEECDHCHGAGYLRFHDPVDSQAPADGGERRSGSRRRRK